jgi:AcrR family transcriptional regulator
LSPRTGRRPGNSDTRALILDAAASAFAELGYHAATIREVARRASVDPALVHHYFGNKEALFTTAMEIPVDPGLVVEQLVGEGTVDTLGERALRKILGVWEDESARAPMLAMIRGAVTSEQGARIMREFISEAIFGRVIGAIEAPDPELRAALIGSQLIGLAFMRFVVAVEPIASADHDALVEAVGPTLQRYLTGEVDSITVQHARMTT